jgi:hypothetical protein
LFCSDVNLKTLKNQYLFFGKNKISILNSNINSWGGQSHTVKRFLAFKKKGFSIPARVNFFIKKHG